jgi:hypothetical protein
MKGNDGCTIMKLLGRKSAKREGVAASHAMILQMVG